jgi:hypothetical protein
VKIKNYRFPCDVCGNGTICSIQVFFKKNGEVSYARARHFGANKFYYHKQSLAYVNGKLRELGVIGNNIDPSQGFTIKTIEQAGKELGSLELGMGIEPIYNSSAGCRLSDSATPAQMQLNILAEGNKNIVGSNSASIRGLHSCSLRLPIPLFISRSNFSCVGFLVGVLSSRS